MAKRGRKPDWRVGELLALVRANPGVETREYWAEAEALGFWGEDFNIKAVEKAQLADLRNLMSRITDDLGHRLVHSVFVRDPETGENSRYYVHEATMDADEYRAVVERYLSTIEHACAAVVELANRCQNTHGVRIRIPDAIKQVAAESETQGVEAIV